MNCLGKLGLNLSSNSNHFIPCLLLFLLHYSSQLTPLFNLDNKSIDPLLLLVLNSDSNCLLNNKPTT